MEKARGSFRILMVEDSASFRDAVSLLIGVYHDIDGAASIAEARTALEKNPYDVVILDRFLPDGDGLDLIGEIKRESPNTAVVMVTTDDDFNTVKRAITAGADDYAVKADNVPAEQLIADLLIRIPFAVARLASTRKLTALEERVRQVTRQELVGRSTTTMEMRNSIFSLKGSNAAVLVTGESGTGKELIAQMLHRIELDSKKDRPFVVVNCAEVQETLSRSDLFGHERGSFTDARESKAGRFELAHGGDIFLDEIGELPYETQGKLLRVIQEGKIYRVGGNKPIQVSCRVIAATNCDLEEMVRQKKFRKDLFYRLNVVRIKTTPLRAHKDDISDLANFFALEFVGGSAKISERAIQRLQQHDWPGNIRELKNTIERAAIMMRKRKGDRLEIEDIAIDSQMNGPEAGLRRMESALPGNLGDLSENGYKEFMELAEREYLRVALTHAEGSVAEVASRIRIGRSTLFRKIAQVGLPRRTYGLRVEEMGEGDPSAQDRLEMGASV